MTTTQNHFWEDFKVYQWHEGHFCRYDQNGQVIDYGLEEVVKGHNRHILAEAIAKNDMEGGTWYLDPRVLTIFSDPGYLLEFTITDPSLIRELQQHADSCPALMMNGVPREWQFSTSRPFITMMFAPSNFTGIHYKPQSYPLKNVEQEAEYVRACDFPSVVSIPAVPAHSGTGQRIWEMLMTHKSSFLIVASVLLIMCKYRHCFSR